jgi:hypothetical protein
MKKNIAFQIAILFIAGLVPLLWMNPGYIISNGDSFPIFLNSQKTLDSATYLWSESTMGTAELMPAFLIYQYIGVFFSYLGFSAGIIEILFQLLLFMGAGFSMFYLAKLIYPEHEIAPLISGIFYMFNFFVLESRLNPGLAWTYAFLPLLMALLLKAIDSAYQPTEKKSNKMLILFSITTMVAFSFASINPTNIALMLIGLFVVVLYELFKYRNNLKPIFSVFSKILLISVPLNLWWLLPLINVYFLSPQVLNSQINVVSWAWTQTRSSFLNLFWFNGFWGWLPEYIPYINAYSNLLLILVFAPFAIGASALLFKSKKSRFNAFIMMFVLIFLFLAKGLHDPLGSVNSVLYKYLPFMNMFREPTSKFTMLVVLFIALLIGYAGSNLTKLKMDKYKRIMKLAVPALLIAIFVVASFPLVTNPLETKTEELPYSSYIKIPDYWSDAASWINSQPGDYKVLFCPLDDFYMMPYKWGAGGYYGVDQLFYRLFEKPVISTDYLYSYVLKPDTVSALQGLMYFVNNGNSSAFKIFLDLLNVKYILQRNDVDVTDRNLLSPEQMQDFFSKQPYLNLVKRFGELDIYEYTEAKPSIYVFPVSLLGRNNFKIETLNAKETMWNFSLSTDLSAWKDSNKFSGGIDRMTIVNGSLNAVLYEGENINSSKVKVAYGDNYSVQTQFKTSNNISKVYLTTNEYDVNGNLTTSGPISPIYGGGDWINASLQFTPSIKTKFVEIQFSLINSSSLSEPTDLLIDNVTLTSQTPVLYSKNPDLPFDSADDQPVTMLQYKTLNPTETVLTVNASQPFIIATSQALDKSWIANINGQQIKPSSLYLGLEGFIIDETGLLDVTIQYQPQIWFNYCSTISIVTLIVCAMLLIYLFLKRR